MISHRALMIIYFKILAPGCNICPESWKTKIAPNSGFFFIGEPKYFTREVICVQLFILYIFHHNGITQRPHDHLFQKSGIWMQLLS